jgi:type I restriction enzyme S subunit
MALNRPILGEKVKFAVLSEKDCPAILYQRVGKIIIKSEKIIQAFLFGLMHTRYFYHELKKRLAGSDQPYINPTELVEMRVYTPPFTLQQKFARIVQKFERLRAQQREAERQAEHLFQTMLHRAFEDK